ncbi:MAG: NAD(P) transhydrogenase subunit alpha [Alphaproteobacteria bacterium]|nr:NAD(P) transhydrogenase subunit alpha [Alphaproteobacteria bacterium]
MLLTIFVLACFVGYYVVLKVTPALHAPLMSVTNAVSSVIIVAAVSCVFVAIIGNSPNVDLCSWLGLGAVFLTAINIVGGFMVTKRMLSMFSTKHHDKKVK